MQYNHQEIEKKWQQFWAENQTFKASNNSDKEKFYVLDMFPYPSGAGLHVGHPLGYIASDIYARYKRHKGFHVLHPQGYDSFGLPAEQYAIQTGQHPAKTTEENIQTYRKQLDKMGFSFDWSREIRTSDPTYYKWTQWIFIQLFESYYCKNSDKARPISELEEVFVLEGNSKINAVCDEGTISFSADDWHGFSSTKKQEILLQYRLAYLSDTEVNWCPALGTVLANDEIVNGVSERGGHPVVRKKMTQWSMRISAYAQRLLDGLEKIDWPQPLKDAQTNWIGRSQGALIKFSVQSSGFRVQSSESQPETKNLKPKIIEVFTTRPDTIFGVSFMTLAPEHELVNIITTPTQKEAVEEYIKATAKRSERDRMADIKTISGVFTGAYALHPFSGKKIPIWIGDYVLASYGTGAVMAVPCGDQRDYDFAKHFNIPIPNILAPSNSPEGGESLAEDEAYSNKEGFVLQNSDFLNGLSYKKATKRVIYELEKQGIGYGKINYRLRDAVFSRQRYWGEPFPVYYKDGMPQMIDTKHLPIILPEVDNYLPTEDGKPPLGNAKKWYWLEYDGKGKTVTKEEFENSSPLGRSGGALELNTMPGWAGSSWYFNRYMDAKNENEFASKEALNYWREVDLYIGGSEHATGHLLYARFWQKFLFDRGFVPVDEFAKKLINQGMILGTSVFHKYADFKIILNLKLIERHQSYPFFRPSEGEVEFIIPVFYKNEQECSNDKIKEEFLKLIALRNKRSKRIVAEEIEINIKSGLFYQEERRLIYDSVDPVTYEINLSKLRKHPLFVNAISVAEDNYSFICTSETEKMSKSKYNVVNPDDIVKEYGADALRLFEMFLGPLEQAKPWKTSGISGVYSFLKKLWKLFHTGENGCFHADSSPLGKSDGAFKILHKTIKKVEEDIENFSFNTSVSTFMIAVNELTDLQCNKREILEPLLILISPYAPHIAEELWSKLGHTTSISTAPFPKFEEQYLVESTKNYPISFNGKMRFTMELPLDLSKEEIEKTVLAHEKTQAQLAGRDPKKIIIVPGKIVNIVG